MKFSANGFYIESYLKCANCGVLIFDGSEEDAARKLEHEGQTYCSQRCVDWAQDRRKRRAMASD